VAQFLLINKVDEIINEEEPRMKRTILHIIFITPIIAFILSSVSYGADVTLAWDPSPDLIDGYRIYYGTSSGNYTESVDVGDTNQATITGLNETTTYYFVARAYDTSGESGNSNEVSWSYNVPDLIAPSINVTGPSVTSNQVITLNGTASDNQAVIEVTWENDRGGSGIAQGTASWTASNVVLLEGVNTITLTAKDAAGNIGTANIQVTLDTTPPAPPIGIRLSSN
jgi:hypothetical protein